MRNCLIILKRLAHEIIIKIKPLMGTLDGTSVLGKVGLRKTGPRR
jgi:hypothetical protein